MKKFCLTVLSLLLPCLYGAAANVEVYNLKTENLVNPIGLYTDTPRFSWMGKSSKQGVLQQAYHILVSSTLENAEQHIGDLWDSGDVTSDQQILVPYSGVRLRPNQRAFWQVRVVTNKGKSDWSPIATFGIGLLSESQWKSRWIGHEGLYPNEREGLHTRLAARYLRHDFKLKADVKRATVYVAGLGLYELHINGERVGTQVLSPVPTDYRKRVLYNAFDVTGLLKADGNAIGVVLGNGRFFPMRQNKPYKTPVFGYPKCRIDMIVEYADGSTETIKTDEKWKLSAEGPIRANNEYDGEEFDARMQLAGWDTYGYNDHSWSNAERVSIPTGELCGQMTPNMQVIKDIRPIQLLPAGSSCIIDFGQNMAGWMSFRVKGNEGDTIRVRYAERLDSAGQLYTANLRDAQSEDVYICNGKEQQAFWHPTFVYHGFRYAEIVGYKEPVASDFVAQVVSDEMEQTGSFECSDTILNQVINNASWGILSNYKGMPIDCPQRNERQPWLGDRTVGSLGESYLFNNERLYSKWVADICDAQRADGNIPDVAPAFWNYYSDDVTWPAALPFSCDMLYEQYGNLEPIRCSYSSIKKWITHMLSEYCTDNIVGHDKYGDWCMPPEKLELIHSTDPARQTDGSLISTAYMIKVMQLMDKFAFLLDMPEESSVWREKASQMTTAFNHRFLTRKTGTSLVPGHVLYPDSVFYGNNTVTANLLPLAFGLVPENSKEEVVKNVIANLITRSQGTVSCGVIGISWLMRTLSDNGFGEVAYLLATNTKYPSWGYMVKNGATTIWELWNGDKANPSMNSGNHVMLLGDLVTWCYGYLGGIRPAAPGYKKIVLNPDFSIPDCFSANVQYTTPYGPVSSKWRKTLEKLQWDVEVPFNTTAEVWFPDGSKKEIGSGSYHFNADIPQRDKAVKCSQFLYEQASFPQCHASTIVELPNGDLLAAYFGGLHENNPDVCIWVSRKPKGHDQWDKPILAADGVFLLGTDDARIAGVDNTTTKATAGPILPRKGWDIDQMRRKACWNPVLFQMPDGELLLFFKVGVKVADWTGWLVRSKDGGKTWSEREPLKEGFLGPIKNKPELVNNRLICPSSTEHGGNWKIHFEILDLATGEWKYVGPIPAKMMKLSKDLLNEEAEEKPIGCIQPSIIKLKDGRLQVLCRSRNQKIATSFSSDGGDTWSEVTLLDVPNNQSGTDAVTLKDGRHVLIYNDFETLPGENKGVRTPLSIAISDDGTHWRHVLTLEDSPISQYSYPAIIQGRDGSLHCVYTWRRQKVSYRKIDLNELR